MDVKKVENRPPQKPAREVEKRPQPEREEKPREEVKAEEPKDRRSLAKA